MLKDLLKEGGLYTLANLFTSGLSLFLIPLYTAYFSPSEFGVLDIIAVYGGLFNALVSLQLGQGLTRFVSDGKIEISEKQKFASTAICFTVILYLVCGTFIFFSDEYFTEIVSSDVKVTETLFDLALITVILNGIFYIQGLYFRANRKTKQFTILSFAHAISNILLTLLFVIGFDCGIIGVYYAAIIVTSILLPVQYIFLKGNIQPIIGKNQLKQLLKFSVPLIPASLSYWFLNFTDRIFINEMCDSTQLGIYSTGAKFSSVITLIIGSFSMAIGPILYERHYHESSQTDLSRVAVLYFSLGTLGVLLISIFSYETLVVFTNEKFYNAALIMPILYTSVWFSGISMFSPGLNLNNRTLTIAIIVVFSSMLNIGLNYFLIPNYGIFGAGISTLISTAINNIILFALSNRLYKLNLPYSKIIMVSIMFSILMILGGYVLPQIFISFWKIILLKVGFGIIYFLVLVKLNLFDIKYIRKLKAMLFNVAKTKS